MSSELVSIVIPTYKRSDKIGRAVASAVRQTYRNVEIIVVDDNAEYPEEREKTAKALKKFPQVTLIQNRQNLGGALSRNVGVQKSHGKYIAFLDDDDEYLPEKVEKQVDAFAGSMDPLLGLMYCNITQSKDISPNDNVIYEQMRSLCIARTSLWLVKKDVLIDVGGFEKSPCFQDAILLLKILLKGYNIYKIQSDLVKCYPHSSSDGVLGHGPSYIVGANMYRDLCRKNYDRLDTKKQVDNVEIAFSYSLIKCHIMNDHKREAKTEFNNIVKRNAFCAEALKSLIKFAFLRIYRAKVIWTDKRYGDKK